MWTRGERIEGENIDRSGSQDRPKAAQYALASLSHFRAVFVRWVFSNLAAQILFVPVISTVVWVCVSTSLAMHQGGVFGCVIGRCRSPLPTACIFGYNCSHVQGYATSAALYSPARPGGVREASLEPKLCTQGRPHSKPTCNGSAEK